MCGERSGGVVQVYIIPTVINRFSHLSLKAEILGWSFWSLIKREYYFDLSFVPLKWGFLHIVWPSVLSLNILNIRKWKKKWKHLCTRNIYTNPGLVLTSLQTTWPSLQQFSLTWACDLMENQHLVSHQLQKNMWSGWAWACNMKLEPATWLYGTGQQIPCFDRCQLTITWMSNIKEGGCTSLSRLHFSVKLLGGEWLPSCTAPSLLSSFIGAHEQYH